MAPKPKPVESKVCPFCAGTFKSLEQHIKYKHESEKPWKCDKCDFAHATKMGLQVQNFIYKKKESSCFIYQLVPFNCKNFWGVK